jgi:protein-arginine kinase activator protein McsA
MEAHVSLLQAADKGALDSLECPQCHKHAVSVRFTQPQRGVYRTWFVCSECSFHTRAQNSERPRHYSDERVDKRLEEYDSDLLSNMRFPHPGEK